MKRKEIGERLKIVRKHYGFTQIQVADYLGITQGQMSKLERGVRRLNMVMVEQLCNLYNINEEWLVNGVGESNLENKSKLHLCFIE